MAPSSKSLSYTHALLSAIPVPDPLQNAARARVILKGDVPSSIDPPAACRFHTRCPFATELCSRVEPPLVDYGGGHLAACHHPIGVTGEELASASVALESPADAGDELSPANGAGRSWTAAGAP